jgi:hypothetical protein
MFDKNQLVIDDDNWQIYADDVIINGELKSRGYVPRDYEQYPEGAFAAPFTLPTIPRAEWKERIEKRDREKAWPKDHKTRTNRFTSLDQDGTNYCWANGPVQAVHYVRAMQNHPHIPLSPASVAAPIKGYRNVGGWGSEALRYIIEYGIAPQSLWPPNAIARRYNTDRVQVERLKFRVLEWCELRNRDFDQLVSAIMYGFPVAVGYNWWGHEVMACAVAQRGRDEFVVDIDNSWGTSFGTNGHAYLNESKATPDDAVVPMSIIPLEPNE